MSTWRELIGEEMEERGEGPSDIESCTLTDEELDAEFDSGFGLCEGVPFTIWTRSRVYFPALYDGSEWVASVPRNPCSEATKHVGCG